MLDKYRNIVFASKALYEGLVGIGLGGSKMEVAMSDSTPITRPREHIEENDRVDATAYGYQKLIAFVESGLRLDKRIESFQKHFLPNIISTAKLKK